MIPRSQVLWQVPPWKTALAQAFRNPTDLLRYLGLEDKTGPELASATNQYPLLVPRFYADLMEKGNPEDPLLRQVLPLEHELDPVIGYSEDPVGDMRASVSTGVLRKYKGRTLLVTTSACAVNCRYCFRRHFPYRGNTASRDRWQEIFAFIRNQTDTREVILSGGDPLMLNDGQLSDLLAGFIRIRHIVRLRIHTRTPIVLPQRVTKVLIESLSSGPVPPVMVMHVNHPTEVSECFVEAMARLKRAGFTLLNQSVLLRGVNDDAAVLGLLSEKLFDAGILPYYLHMLDKVKGAAHFAVDRQTALRIQAQLADTLPGYLVPRLVSEQPGAAAKTPVTE